MKKLQAILSFIFRHPIGSRKPLISIRRLIHFQLLGRIKKSYLIYSFVNESAFLVKKGFHGLSGNVYVGLQEFEHMSFLLHFLSESDSFADVGANVGAYTILASGVRGAKTYAFEPIPSSFNVIKDNVELNKIAGKVKLFNNGVGDMDEILRFSSDFDTINHVVNESGGNVIEVQVIKLDDVKDFFPNMIKIDVEGFEIPVLRGAEKFFKDDILKAVIIETNNSGSRYGFTDEDIDTYLRNRGFDPFTYDAFSRELVQLGSYNSNGNTLYLRDPEFIIRRLQEAPAFEVFGIKI